MKIGKMNGTFEDGFGFKKSTRTDSSDVEKKWRLFSLRTSSCAGFGSGE